MTVRKVLILLDTNARSSQNFKQVCVHNWYVVINHYRNENQNDLLIDDGRLFSE